MVHTQLIRCPGVLINFTGQVSHNSTPHNAEETPLGQTNAYVFSFSPLVRSILTQTSPHAHAVTTTDLQNNASVWYAGTPELATAYFQLNYIRAFSVNSTPIVEANASSSSNSASGSASSANPSESGPATVATSEAGVLIAPWCFHVMAVVSPLLGWALL